ncbi:MAG: M3 family oligoendopeptidase, partial [Betaproteobacteria bacterium]
MTRQFPYSRRTTAVFALFGGLFLSLGLATATAAERTEDRWNLADLYPTLQAWHDDAARLDTQLKEFAACRGKLGESARRFKSCLELQADATKRYYRLDVYANELLAEDTGAAASLELSQKSQVLGSRANEATSFFSPEILALGKNRVAGFFKQEPGLTIYRQPVDQILRAAPHTLDAKGEAIVAAFGLSANATGSVYNIFANAELPWATVKLADGTSVKLDKSAYEEHRESANRDDRKKVFDAFWGSWKEFERTFGVAFYERLKEDTVLAKIRKYPDSLTRALDANKIPVSVYDTLIAQTHANLPTLHRYFRLRARMLGVSEMRYYDIYPPLVKSDLKYSIDTGKQLMRESLKPMGSAYVAAVEKGLKERWMDVYPRPRKLSGAHMAGAAYDVHPYLLLNHTDNYASVSTLSHEWGHAMHSYHSNRAQPFVTADYTTFVAEIASTFQEALLLDHMLKIARTDDERMLYLGSALEALRGAFFRQAMFAEFEREAHARVDRGESLTGETLTRLYADILRRYH